VKAGGSIEEVGVKEDSNVGNQACLGQRSGTDDGRWDVGVARLEWRAIARMVLDMVAQGRGQLSQSSDFGA
jgi:hypothetical protein